MTRASWSFTGSADPLASFYSNKRAIQCALFEVKLLLDSSSERSTWPYVSKGSILSPSPESSPCRGITAVFSGKLASSTSRRQDKKNGFGSLLAISRRTVSSCPAWKMRLNFWPLLLVQTNLRPNHHLVQRSFNLFPNVLKPSLRTYSLYDGRYLFLQNVCDKCI